jgi:hypothetical protein
MEPASLLLCSLPAAPVFYKTNLESTMSYTLEILRGARKALLEDNKLEAMKRINILIDRHEKILNLRKNWSKAERMKNANNTKAKTAKAEVPGKLGSAGNNGIQSIRQRLRCVDSKDGQGSPDSGGERLPDSGADI